MAIVVIGIYLGFKREFSKRIGFLVVALVAVGLVFYADRVKEIVVEEGIDQIAKSAFEGCSWTKKVTLPEGIS